MGHIVSADGMRPDPRKVEAIVNMPRPSDRQDLLRLLGMIKYLAQYIPNESNITAPLRSLLKQDVEWSWQPEHDVQGFSTTATNDASVAAVYAERHVCAW